MQGNAHEILEEPLVVISVGVRTFADSFERQGGGIHEVHGGAAADGA